jgi:hypothetical protein
MRTHITVTVAFGLIASAATADTMKNCSAAWSAMSSTDKAKTTYKAYSTMCLKSDYTVPASSGTMSSGTMSSGAMSVQPPAGATGKCKDGTYTMATTHSGACSSHGGVDSWLPGH